MCLKNLFEEGGDYNFAELRIYLILKFDKGIIVNDIPYTSVPNTQLKFGWKQKIIHFFLNSNMF